MKKQQTKFLTLAAMCLTFAMAVFCGGCGGGGDSAAKKLYVIGDMHGDISNELESLRSVSAYDGGSTDAPIVYSNKNGASIDADTGAVLREFLNAGQAVAIEHADSGEISSFLGALGFEDGALPPSDDTYVEFYGVKMVSGDVFAYVALNDNEDVPESLDVAPDSIMSGDVLVSQDTTPQPMTFTSGDETIQFSRPQVSTPASEDEHAVAENICEWLDGGAEQAAEAARAKKQTAAALNSAAATNDLTSISPMYQLTYDASMWKNTFKISVEVYACHTFNAANNEDSDWFFVKQKGQLNPSGSYKNTNHKRTDAALIEGYITEYSFDNWTVNASGDFNNNAVLMDSKPNTTIGSSGFSSGISYSLGGNVGFSGFALSGGVSAGVSYSTSESQTVPDCQVQNASLPGNASGVAENRAKWSYTFSRPIVKGGPYFGACNDFYDAPLASRSLFQPVNQWAWKIPPEERDKIKGFKFKFKWTSGYSYSAAYAWWVKVSSEKHYNHTTQEKEFYVPFAAIYPPLIAANKLDFSKSAQHKKLELGTYRDWTAASNQAWCTLNRYSGTRADTGDVFVTVDENGTGADRNAEITLKTTDNKGEFKVKVFQSRY